MLNLAREGVCKLRERSALGLGNVKDGYHSEHGDFNLLFLHDGVPVLIQQRRFGIGVELYFFDFLFIWRGRDDLDTFFALAHMPSKLIPPFVISCDAGSIRALHCNQQRVVDGVTVKAGHGAKVLPVFIAFKQVFDALFDAVGDLPQAVFAAFLFHGVAPF